MTDEHEEYAEEPQVIDPLEALELERIEYGERLASVYLQSSGELLTCAKLEPDWLVPNAVPAGAINFIVGKPGASKSWAAYDLACAVVQRRDWMGLGVPTVNEGASVFILNFDNPHSECARRFLRLGLTAADNLWVHSWGAHTPPEPFPAVLQLPDAFEPLEAMVYAKRPVLIVVDSLRQAHTGDESSSQEMALIMAQLKRFAAYGAAVVIVHHTRKNDGAMRGSTEIEATADSIADVEKEDAQVSLVSWRKTRGWDMAESTITIRLIDEGDRTYVRGGMSLTQLIREAGPLSRSDIGKLLKLSQGQTKKIVERALERGVVAEKRDGQGGRLIELVEITRNEIT